MSQCVKEIQRLLDIYIPENPLKGSGAAFLWGPRQSGKTTLLNHRYPDALRLDLLQTDAGASFTVRPALLREKVLAERPSLVVIDEIQKVPALIDEVHWLLENTPVKFILCGSSARKLKRAAHNLLGGRAVDHQLFPLTSAEIGAVDLLRMLNQGGLPVHYLSDDPGPLLRAYLNSYLKEEIIAESATRNVPAFAHFLETVALSHGQQLNFANAARESGVSAATVRNYYQILKDTLMGFELPPWRRTRKRRLVESSKFFLFDIGVANALHPDAPAISPGTDLFGRCFEHFILNEIRAYLAYNRRAIPLAYWRTSSGLEVDIIAGSGDLAIECKSSAVVRESELKGMRAFADDCAVRRKIVVSREESPRRTEDGIEILPWGLFCRMLWGGETL